MDDKWWLRNSLRNKHNVNNIPIWLITKDANPEYCVEWVKHAPNPRFAINDVNGDSSGVPDYYSDDLVLDKEKDSSGRGMRI